MRRLYRQRPRVSKPPSAIGPAQPVAGPAVRRWLQRLDAQPDLSPMATPRRGPSVRPPTGGGGKEELMTRLTRKLRAAVVAAAAAAVLGATLFGGGTAEAASTYLPYHDASYSCGDAIFDITIPSVTAFRLNPNVPETVYWTAWLQQQVGSGWVTVKGSNPGWLSFPAAYIDPVRGPVYGALIGSNVPHWKPATAGTYRLISQFYWSSKGVYSSWEPGPGCPLIPFIIR
jgi:hypothetical protein